MSPVVKEKAPGSPRKLTYDPDEEAVTPVSMSNIEAWLAPSRAGKIQDLLDLAPCMDSRHHELKSDVGEAPALPVLR